MSLRLAFALLCSVIAAGAAAQQTPSDGATQAPALREHIAAKRAERNGDVLPRN